ncbi:MAG: hypothetical protein HY074_08120 [Deltaproteobacteria bacterium]|nr:hypothetical protein [Deltaproteobacteria bacterium]
MVFYIPLLFAISISAGATSTTKSTHKKIVGIVHPEAAQPESLGPTELRFRAADVAFRARFDEIQAREALRIYRELYQQNPNDVAGTWRLAMAAYFVGFRLTSDDDKRKEIYAEGRDAGFAGAKLDEKCAACHFWGALDLALYGHAVGIFKMFFALGDLRDHLNEVIKIDPHYAYGGAYRMLGVIEQKLPGILGGSNRRAQDYFEKAIEISPVPAPDRIEAIEAIADLKALLEKEAARNIARDSALPEN